MNTHGHHSCAETAGEPVLQEALTNVGASQARLGAFYLGNWLTDVSQAVDPVAYMAGQQKAGKLFEWIDGVVADIRSQTIYKLAVKSRVVSDVEFTEAIEEGKRKLKAAFDRFFGDGDGGRDSTLGQAFKSAFFCAGYFKFVHPEGPDTMAYEGGFKAVFESMYSQYYPHEHLDRPEKKYRPGEASQQSSDPDAPPEYAQQIGGGLRSQSGGQLKLNPDMYEYLRDDIEVAAALIAGVDRDWASKVFRGGVVFDDECEDHNLFLAILGHALHAVEDFFAHSIFAEHAAELLGGDYLPAWYQVRSREVVQRRLTRWSNPGDEDRDDLDRLPREEHIVTGFFDFKDTAVSLLHILEEVFDAKTMGLGDQIREVHDGIESAPAHAEEKFAEFRRVLTESLEFVSDPDRALEDANNETAQALKKKYEEERRKLVPNPLPRRVAQDVVSVTPLFEDVPPEVVQNFVLVCEYFGAAKTVYGYTMTLYDALKEILEFIANPWAYILNKLKAWGLEWIMDIVEHYAKELIYDWIGQLRIGCHSLLAKDHGGEWLYKQQKNCAMAVHYYIVKLLVRHGEPDTIDGARAEDSASGTDQINSIDSRQWIDWLEVLEFFLRHPRAVLTECREERYSTTYSLTHVVRAGSGDSLLSLSQKYSPSAEGGTLTWQRIADVNFHTTGLSEDERKRVINQSLRDSGTGYRVDDYGNYAFNPGWEVTIPDQVMEVRAQTIVESSTSWFREVFESETWEVFKGWEDAATRSSRKPIESHAPVYITRDELDDLIEKGMDLRKKLEDAYVPGGAAGSPPPRQDSTRTRYDFYKELIESIGQFDTGDRCVNVVGVRAFQNGARVTNIADEYNDTVAVVWLEDGQKRCREFVASVDPGQYYTDNPMNMAGCAHLIDGQYSYKPGKHGSAQRDAFVEAGPVSVWRDSDGDYARDAAERQVYTSASFGIHIHAGGTGDAVGKSSAGCQVIYGGWSGEPWQSFKSICQAHPKASFNYTLVDADDAARYEYPAGGGSDASNAASGAAKVETTLDVQKALNKLGFRDYESKLLTEDGADGPRTQSAVKTYQNARGLAVDGIAGPQTKSKLTDDLA